MQKKRYKLIKLVFLPFTLLFETLLRSKNLIIVWRAGPAIGDNFLMAGFAALLNKKDNLKVLVLSNYSEVLQNSPWIYKAINFNKVPFKMFLYYLLKLMGSSRVVEYMFPLSHYGYKDLSIALEEGFFKNFDNPPVWRIHVADRYPKEYFLNFSGGLSYFKNGEGTYLIKNLRKNQPNKIIGIINPHGKTTYTSLKSFGYLNYQKIVCLTKKEIIFIQVGLKTDKKLEFIDVDARGKSLLFLIDLIANSDFVLADEGVNNHIAGSFPKVNSYVPYSLFAPPEYFSYKNTFILGSDSDIEKIKNKNNFNKNDTPAKFLLDIDFIANQILKKERKNFRTK